MTPEKTVPASRRVYGHSLPPPRLTLWVPLLLACLLSLIFIAGLGAVALLA